MPDREKVIKAYECCKNPFDRMCEKCPYEKDCCHDGIPMFVIKKMVELLKEQEHKDKMFHALEEDWKRLKDLQIRKPDGQRKTGCDGCENKGSEDCALGKPGSENAYCPNGKLR